MQEKQKVTLYIPPGIHRQLKIRAAIDTESMSAIVEKAIAFYLKHPEKVEEAEAESYGKTHEVHVCPECSAAMVEREGKMVSLKNQPSVIDDEEFPIKVKEKVREKVREKIKSASDTQGKEKLVPC